MPSVSHAVPHVQRGGLLAAVLAVVIVLGAPEPALAQGFPFCRPGQSPQFTFGFASLKAHLGPTMGEPIECEHPNNANGDTLQRTSTGLAYWRKSTNTPTFTDGYRHWAITSAGLVAWVGASPDPPATATPAAPIPGAGAPTRTLESFVGGVSGQIDAFWSEVFQAAGVQYASPRMQWVPRGAVIPSCGPPASSPFYCSSTRTVVLPAIFFERLWQNDADAAVAVVIAHEWGHHIQRSLGMFSGDYFSIQTELQADCLAGVFFQYAGERGWLDPGDIDEALAISWRGGDSVLVAWFEESAHGTPRQRVEAFSRGFQGTQSCSVYTS
jgi:hypothetical protein